MKTFELVKELLLLQVYGAGNSVDTAIELAIDIHCEQNNIDINKFKEELKRKKELIPMWRNYDEQKKYCEIYEALIEGMRHFEHSRKHN